LEIVSVGKGKQLVHDTGHVEELKPIVSSGGFKDPKTLCETTKEQILHDQFVDVGKSTGVEGGGHVGLPSWVGLLSGDLDFVGGVLSGDLELMEMSTTGFGWSVGVGSGEIMGVVGCGGGLGLLHRSYQ